MFEVTVEEPAQYIQIALFPATVVIDGVEYGDANKVYLTDSNFYVIQDSPTPTGPFIAFQCPATREQFARPTKTLYTVTTTEHNIEFHRALNCGCGSRLRGVNPFAGVPYIAVKRVGE